MATSDNYESSAKFADIVDDCLWYTLEQLSFKEKFAVMQVCKRWRKVTAEMIENEDCLKLEIMPKTIETSEIRIERPDYSDKESVKRNLKAIIGKQAEMFFNYKLEYVEKVNIKGFRDTISHSQWLKLDDIGWLFKRLPLLKSLSMTETPISNFGYRGFQIGSPLNVLSTRLKSLELNSFEDAHWLSSLLEKENVLEELFLKKGFYRCLYDPPKLLLLKRTRLDVRSLEEMFMVIENSLGLLDIRINFFRLPYESIFQVLSFFTRFTQLETLKLGFVRSLNANGTDEVLDDALHFPNLRHFKLAGVSVQHSKFEKILAKMPAIKSLKLRNVCVRCTCNEKICRDCPKLFIEKIASLEHLKELHLNNRAVTGCNSHFVDVLERLIDDERLPRLRKLRCTLANLFSPTLFEAFANMAWETPKESFIMIAPFDDQPNKEELLSFKPRNLQAIHSRCTVKTDSLTPRLRRTQTSTKSSDAH